MSSSRRIFWIVIKPNENFQDSLVKESFSIKLSSLQIWSGSGWDSNLSNIAPSLLIWLVSNLKNWLTFGRFYPNKNVIAKAKVYFTELDQSHYLEGRSSSSFGWSVKIEVVYHRILCSSVWSFQTTLVDPLFQNIGMKTLKALFQQQF